MKVATKRELESAAGAVPRKEPPATRPDGLRLPRNVVGLAVYLVLLAALFSKPLYQWLRYGLKTEVDSYIILMPIVVGYLVWIQRPALNLVRKPDFVWVMLWSSIGGLFLALHGFAPGAIAKFPASDRIAISTLAFLAFSLAGVGFCLNPQVLRQLAFPISMLVFMVPLPVALREGIESFLQHGSADLVEIMLRLSPVSFHRTGLIFKLSTITIEVAQECSGIRASMVLFITSLLGGYLFLQQPWKRALLAMIIIPLGLLRNALRIGTISALCTYVGRDMIESWVHRQGGPFFFALSLVPFFTILFLLRRSEDSSGRHPEGNYA